MRTPGAELCARFEGMHTVRNGMVHAYLCPANYPTQGRGIVVPSMYVPPITIEEAELRFDIFFARYEAAAVKMLKVHATPNQIGALASFCFNVGIGALKSSTLLRKFNRGDPADEVAREFLKWNKGGGRVLPGLTRRRAAEAALFLGE